MTWGIPLIHINDLRKLHADNVMKSGEIVIYDFIFNVRFLKIKFCANGQSYSYTEVELRWVEP